jgi:hypothetical protein
MGKPFVEIGRRLQLGQPEPASGQKQALALGQALR